MTMSTFGVNASQQTYVNNTIKQIKKKDILKKLSLSYPIVVDLSNHTKMIVNMFLKCLIFLKEKIVLNISFDFISHDVKDFNLSEQMSTSFLFLFFYIGEQILDNFAVFCLSSTMMWFIFCSSLYKCWNYFNYLFSKK